MKRVYQVPKRRQRPLTTVAGAVVFTCLLFLIVPLPQLISAIKEQTFPSQVEVVIPPPPPPPQSEPPPPEPETQPEEPELQPEFMPLTLDQLELALNPGAGNAGIDSALSFLGALPDALEELRNIFELSELDQTPRPIHRVAPVYPFDMRRSGITGHAIILFVVDDQGKVRDARVESSSHVEFERPALEAVAQWRFEPGIKDGRAVSTRMRVPIRFNLGQ